MTNKPPTGLFRRCLFVWRRLRCRHVHVVFWYPKDFFTFERVKDEWDVPKDFMRMLYCVDCGATWGENCADRR